MTQRALGSGADTIVPGGQPCDESAPCTQGLCPPTRQKAPRVTTTLGSVKKHRFITASSSPPRQSRVEPGIVDAHTRATRAVRAYGSGVALSNRRRRSEVVGSPRAQVQPTVMARRARDATRRAGDRLFVPIKEGSCFRVNLEQELGSGRIMPTRRDKRYAPRRASFSNRCNRDRTGRRRLRSAAPCWHVSVLGKSCP